MLLCYLVVIPSNNNATITFQLSTGPADTVTVQLGTLAPVAATYNAATSTYSAMITPLADGAYTLTINAFSNGEYYTIVSEVFSLTAIADLSVTTKYGILNESSVLNITDLTFEQATTSGLDLNVSLSAGSNVTAMIAWGDGQELNCSLPADSVNHVYATGGTYSLLITATSPLGLVHHLVGKYITSWVSTSPLR